MRPSGASVKRAASVGPAWQPAQLRAAKSGPSPFDASVEAGAGTQSRSKSALPITASSSPDAAAPVAATSADAAKRGGDDPHVTLMKPIMPDS